jgi:hypothetical protein
LNNFEFSKEKTMDLLGALSHGETQSETLERTEQELTFKIVIILILLNLTYPPGLPVSISRKCNFAFIFFLSLSLSLTDYVLHYKSQEFYMQLPKIFFLTNCTGGILRLCDRVD